MKLKDKIMTITGFEDSSVKSGSFKLKDGIEVKRGLLDSNDSYRPQDNLLESRVLGNISSVLVRH